MICLNAYAKINWTLNILGTRDDGYHQMDMLMQSVDVCDTLWLEEDETLSLCSAGSEEENAASDGLSSQAVMYDQSNLVYRAALALKQRFGIAKGARIRLQKRIPSGAGMGGGSADAAAALIGLNRLWGLGFDRQQLCAIGLTLGADVPFMLTGGLARVGGIGEEITPLSPAPRVPLVLMQPCDGLSTGKIFSAYDALGQKQIPRPDNALAQSALLKSDLFALSSAMNNVLEAVSLPARPALGEALSVIQQAGAVHAMMTGSGSVVYGVFQTDQQAEAALNMLLPMAAEKGWGQPFLTHTRREQTAL